MAERVERTGGLLVHHPGPPPLGAQAPAPCDVCNGLDPDCAACELAQVESPCNDYSTPQHDTTLARRTP